MEEDVIYIGKKPIMKYISGIVLQFHTGKGKIKIVARGKMISKAVDVVQAAKNKFLKDLNINKVEIGTQEIERDGKKSNVSVIEIEISK